MPISYYLNRQVIKVVTDASYNIPAVNDEVIINSCIFTVQRKVMQPYAMGKRQYFIDLKPKENV